MRAYYELLRILYEIFDEDVDVNTITQGDITDIDLNKKNIFNLVHLSVNSSTFNENTQVFNVTIFAMGLRDINKEVDTFDKFRTNDNEIDNLNTTHAILRRGYNKIIHGKFAENGDDICVLNNPTLEPFTEQYENLLDGWSMTIDIEVEDTLMCVCCE